MTSGGAYRVGNDDRERAVAELRRAAEDGRLSAEELDERTARARSARTNDELSGLLADLGSSGAVAMPVRLPTAAEALAALARVGYRPDDPLVLNAGVSGESRSGSWTVPPFMIARAGIETVRIDCLQASAAAEVIDLLVEATLGTVVLVVPEGWAVNVDQVVKGMGTLKVAVPGVPAAGCPVFIVRGSLNMGTFKARHATRFDRWRLRRQQRRQRAISAR
ncbi:putative protein [Propionicimonas sp. T2.31MG-18]|uniref:DUF1707 SHOCT-like domain-containing protein n=1 Tax=Propionicimonas sp. T2.31MG-18 TaxID=3157620 RepID=UPI0035EC61B7